MSDQEDELEEPKRDALGRWLPGESGNSRGMPKGHRRLTNDLYRLLSEMPSAAEMDDIFVQLEVPEDLRQLIIQSGDRQEMFARVLIWRAGRGNWKAFEEVFGRLEPIHQSHEISGPGGGPIAAIGLNIAGSIPAETAQDRYLALVKGAPDGTSLESGNGRGAEGDRGRDGSGTGRVASGAHQDD